MRFYLLDLETWSRHVATSVPVKIYFDAQSLRRRQSSRPITRTPFLMCHGNNYYLRLEGQIEQVEREPLKNELACSVLCQWILSGGFDDSRYGIVNGVDECGPT